jgi:hypothetical protein
MQTWTESGELKIGYKGKMFAQPVVEYTLEHAIPNGGSPEEDKMIRAAYEKQWDAMMTFLKKTRASTIKRTMDRTEKDIAKKLPGDKKESIAKANAQIERGLDLLRRVEIKRLAEGCMAKVYNDLEKALAKKVPRQIVKTELKIDQPVLIKLAVEEDTTAEPEQKEDVLDAKLIASIIAVVRAIATGAGAIAPSVKSVRNKYISYYDFMEEVKRNVAKLDEAVDYQKKKVTKDEWRKLSDKDKAKLLLAGGCSPIMKSLASQFTNAQKDVASLREEFRMAQLALDDMASVIKKLPPLQGNDIEDEFKRTLQEVKKADGALETLEDNLSAYSELKVEVELLIDNLEKKGEFDSKRVSAIRRLAARAEGKGVIILFVEAVSKLPMAAGKLSKAADKLSKAAGR